MSAAVRRTAPGLGLVAALAAAAALIASLPGFGVVGPLVMALLLGLAWSGAVGTGGVLRPGARFAGSTLLKIAVVLLGVRLDFRSLADVGAPIVVADLLVVAIGMLVAAYLGRRSGVSPGLRRSLGVGTSICGATAIVAAAAVTRADDRDVSIAVAVISVLGSVAVVALALAASVLDVPDELLGFLIGATLQEVGHVVAAGYSVSPEAGDLAVLVKLSRVALLAPLLLLLGIRARASEVGAADGAGGARPAVVPWFLAGFLALAAANTVGMLPMAAQEPLYRASVLLTSAAMVGIGLQVDLRGFLRAGSRALLVGSGAFLGLIVAMVAYASAVFR